jgi:hypothetical protein
MPKTVTKSGNKETVAVSIKSILWRSAFRKGFEDARNGIPYDYEIFKDNMGDRWTYERGRQFGMLYKGKLKYGKEVSGDAIHQFARAVASRVII